jgi:hypothetical protein
MTLLAKWYVLVSDFVNLVNLVNLVRTNISHQVSLPEREISHQVHQVPKVHNQDRFTTSHHFSGSPFENLSGAFEFCKIARRWCGCDRFTQIKESVNIWRICVIRGRLNLV